MVESEVTLHFVLLTQEAQKIKQLPKGHNDIKLNETWAQFITSIQRFLNDRRINNAHANGAAAAAVVSPVYDLNDKNGLNNISLLAAGDALFRENAKKGGLESGKKAQKALGIDTMHRLLAHLEQMPDSARKRTILLMMSLVMTAALRANELYELVPDLIFKKPILPFNKLEYHLSRSSQRKNNQGTLKQAHTGKVRCK